jgi:Mor family transcriptional regulator
MIFPENYPELLVDIAQEVARALTELGAVETAKGEEIGLQIAERIRARFGGIQHYIPKGDAVDIAKRDWEIYAKFDGTNSAELAIEYDLTDTRIRQIVKACKDEDQRRRQIALI